MKKLSQDAKVIIVLLVFLFAAVFIAGQKGFGERKLEPIPRRTTYSAKPGGLKALYETLDTLGYQPVRHLEPLTVEPKDGVLFLSDPETPISKEEWTALKSWVEKGNLLVYSVGSDVDLPEIENYFDTLKTQPTSPSFVSPGVHSFTTAANGGIEDDEWSFERENGFESPFDMSGKKKEKTVTVEAEKKPLTALFKGRSETSAAFSAWGKGGVLVLSSPWPLSNQGIKADDNIVFVMNILDNWDSGRRVTATFDEYHHGYGATEGLLSLIDKPARLGLGQIAVAFIILLFAVSRRFGRPIPFSEGGRYRSEYLTSMSALLKRAHAVRLVRTELARKFLQDAAVALGLPPNAEPAAIVEAAQNRRSDKAKALRELVEAATAIPSTEMNEDALLKLSHQWYQMRKDLTKRS